MIITSTSSSSLLRALTRQSLYSLRSTAQRQATPSILSCTQSRTLRSLADLDSLSSKASSPLPKSSSASTNVAARAASMSDKKPTAASPSQPPSIILTLSGSDQPGIVHNVSGFLAKRGMNIMDSAQFGDPTTGTFFMRVHASDPTNALPAEKEARMDLINKIKSEFETEFAGSRDVSFEIHDAEEKPRTLIMVSKIGHCLNDLLFRLSSNSLPIEVPLIISNHPDYAPLAAAHNIPFYHLPIDPKNGKTKEWQESEMVRLANEYKIELVVLARYMQILSPKLCEIFSGRIINIHHSFLPSFKGAKPYHQAFERGVKLIGATAHFVTSDLDEGPIIEQAVERVNHAMTPKDLVKAGADVEARVLARAVKWTAERRVLANGAKTVVFNY